LFLRRTNLFFFALERNLQETTTAATTTTTTTKSYFVSMEEEKSHLLAINALNFSKTLFLFFKFPHFFAIVVVVVIATDLILDVEVATHTPLSVSHLVYNL